MKSKALLKFLAYVFTLIIVSTAISLLFMTTASSAEINMISADKVETKAGEVVQIPVRIVNNTGFMGFSFNIHFDNRFLTPLSANRGQLLSNGIFDDSIGVNQTGIFKVLFSSTTDIIGDGELFVLHFRVQKNTVNNQKIEISYNKADSFNERWEEVHFQCKDVIVNVESSSGEIGTETPESENINVFQRLIAFIQRFFETIKKLFSQYNNQTERM